MEIESTPMKDCTFASRQAGLAKKNRVSQATP